MSSGDLVSAEVWILSIEYLFWLSLQFFLQKLKSEKKVLLNETFCWPQTVPERIYNPIKEMGFSPMFSFRLDNTKR